MFPLGLAGKDLIPLDPTERAEKFWRRSVDDMTSLHKERQNWRRQVIIVANLDGIGMRPKLENNFVWPFQ